MKKIITFGEVIGFCFIVFLLSAVICKHTIPKKMAEVYQNLLYKTEKSKAFALVILFYRSPFIACFFSASDKV